MAEAPAHETTRVVFELHRFEQVAPDRLEVEGRWSGVRGRRFIRPSLSVGANGTSERLLAELEHKPWPPESSEPWKAAFVADSVSELNLASPELAVAPDIAVQLPAPSADAARDVRIVAGEDAPPPPRPTPRSSGAKGAKRPTLAELRSALAAAESDRARVKDTVQALEGQLESLRDELATARAESETQHTAHAETREQLTAARADLRELASERDRIVSELYAAHSERDGALAERDAAVAQREAAEAERERALSERDGMRAARDVADRGRVAAQAERDELVAARDEALTGREEARATRDEAVRARDEALRARDEAARARDAALAELRRQGPAPRIASVPPPAPAPSAELEELRAEVASLRLERDALLAQRTPTVAEPDPAARAAAALRNHPALDLPALQPHVGWARRVAALTVLLVCLIALAIITHVF